MRQPTSKFAKRLAADPELRKRVEKVIKTVKESAREELDAMRDAERITGADLSVVINAKPE